MGRRGSASYLLVCTLQVRFLFGFLTNSFAQRLCQHIKQRAGRLQAVRTLLDLAFGPMNLLRNVRVALKIDRWVLIHLGPTVWVVP
jgi:hypothetical protein